MRKKNILLIIHTILNHIKEMGLVLLRVPRIKVKTLQNLIHLVINKNTKIAYLNGEKFNYQTTEYYDPSKSVQEDGFNSFIRVSSNEAVYVSTSKTTFSEQVNSISQLVTVIGCVIAIGVRTRCTWFCWFASYSSCCLERCSWHC